MKRKLKQQLQTSLTISTKRTIIFDSNIYFRKNVVQGQMDWPHLLKMYVYRKPDLLMKYLLIYGKDVNYY